MKTYVILILGLLFGLNLGKSFIINSMPLHFSKDSIPFGKWKPIDLISASPTSMSLDDARKFLKKILIIDKSESVVFGDTCKNPIYSLNKITDDQYFTYYDHLPYNELHKLGMDTDRHLILTIACGKDDIDSFNIVINKDNLLMAYDNGFTYVFKKDNSANSSIGNKPSLLK